MKRTHAIVNSKPLTSKTSIFDAELDINDSNAKSLTVPANSMFSDSEANPPNSPIDLESPLKCPESPSSDSSASEELTAILSSRTSSTSSRANHVEHRAKNLENPSINSNETDSAKKPTTTPASFIPNNSNESIPDPPMNMEDPAKNYRNPSTDSTKKPTAPASSIPINSDESILNPAKHLKNPQTNFNQVQSTKKPTVLASSIPHNSNESILDPVMGTEDPVRNCFARNSKADTIVNDVALNKRPGSARNVIHLDSNVMRPDPARSSGNRCSNSSNISSFSFA